jgi:crotonobetainyl-CoA:carnitine CoA-transferase CaiB-like acyl-CoA transferase
MRERTDLGKTLPRAMAAKADVLVENFAPGAMDRLGLGWASLQAGGRSLGDLDLHFPIT